MSTPPPGKLALPELAEMKRRGDRIVMVTAYDTPGARFAEDAGVDVLLVGDTAAMVVLGYESTTVPVTMDEMLFLTRTVVRAARRPIVVGDMPFGSYQVSDELEGRFRPGHFRAVATVCLKLFTIVRPDRAYFGQKDAQQVEVLRRMIRDLALELELRVLPTVRDPDGLALSSRNALLTPEERRQALALPRALATRDPERARALLDGLEVDYVAVAPFDPPVLAAAVRVGSTRLIDNVVLEIPCQASALLGPTNQGESE